MKTQTTFWHGRRGSRPLGRDALTAHTIRLHHYLIEVIGGGGGRVYLELGPYTTLLHKVACANQLISADKMGNPRK